MADGKLGAMAKNLDGILSGFRRERTSATETKGRPGFAIYGGYIQEIEKNQQLTGREKYRTYSDIIANTAIVAAGTRYFLNLVAKAAWNVEPADDSDQAEEFAERLREIMEDIDTPWHRIIRRAAMYRFYGYSIQEWTAKRNEDGTIGIKDIAPRPQITIERWDTNDIGEIEGVVQRAPQTQLDIYLPRFKLVYVVDDTLNDSPEGLGLFRHVVDSVKRLRRFEQLEGFGFETDLRGVPVGRAPFAELQQLVDSGEITATQRDQIIAPLKQFMQNHIKSPSLALMLDSATYQTEDEAARPSNVYQYDIELLQSGNTTQEAVAQAIERLNQEIARILGVEGLLLGSTNHGSQALSTDKSHNFALVVDGTLLELGESFKKDFIDTVWRLNGWPEELKPSFKIEATQYRDVTQITQALRDLALAGAPLALDDPAINEVRDLLGLSKQEMTDLLRDMDVSLMGNRQGNDNDDINDNNETEDES